MRWVILFLLVAISGGLGVYGAGSALPEEFVVLKGVQLQAPQKEVWERVRQVEAYAEWQPAIEEVIALPDPLSGEAVWHLKNTQGKGMIVDIPYQLPPDIVHLETLESDLPYEARWEISVIDKTVSEEGAEISAQSPESFVKIEATSTVSNPFLRFYVQYIAGYAYLVEDYLKALATSFQQPNAEIKELIG